jgi:hypothetical protein
MAEQPEPGTQPPDSTESGDDHAVVARYHSHADAEAAVRLLHRRGIDPRKVSIVGRNFEVREDVLGFYRPSDRVREGAVGGSWVGGFFGLFAGLAFFVFPGVGPLLILGPLAGAVVGALGGAGLGGLVAGLMSLGMDEENALRYQSHVQAGEFLVVVHGGEWDALRAREILQGTESHGVGVFSQRSETSDASETSERT